MKVGALPLREHNSKKVKIHRKYFKIFSRTTGPISTRHGTNHHLGEGIRVCSNEGQHPYLRGDNSKSTLTMFKNLLQNQ
jgi:hypothetical protein